MATFEVQFVADVGPVMIDRTGAEEEFVGDLVAGLVLGDQLSTRRSAWVRSPIPVCCADGAAARRRLSR